MNIKNLAEYIEENGNEFKSYRHLCEVLEIKPKGGNQKKAQMKEIQRYIKLSKGNGYRLIVDEVYDFPLPKEDNRDKYGQLVQLLLTDYFAKSNRQTLELTLNDILRLVNLINKNYSLASNNIPKFSKILGIEDQITYDHFSLTNNSLKKNVERALDSLSDMHLINVHKGAVFITETDNSKRLAELDEIELFEQAGEEALQEIFKSRKRSEKKMSNVRYTKNWSRYKQISSKNFARLMKNKLNRRVKNAYIGYRIVINRDAIITAHDELLIEYLDEATRIDYLDKIEKIVLDDLINKAINRQKKARNVNEKVSERMREYRARFTYVEDSKKIIELTHKQDAEDLSAKMNQKTKRDFTNKENEAIAEIFN